MWLMTTAGFFSIVRKPWDDDTLTVRSRCKADLNRFRKLCPTLGPTKTDRLADYRFRAQAPKTDVAIAVMGLTAGIDYDNFKHEIGLRDARRAELYAKVWSALLALQDAHDPRLEPHDWPTLFDSIPRRKRARKARKRRRLT